MDTMKETEKKMQGALDHLKNDLKGLRTGRANPSVLETVFVEVYGAQMRIQDVATISVPESRQLLISPFDAQNVHAIAKGVEAANLNLQPIVDGNVVRIKIPEMDQSVRQDMVKQAKRKCEEAKISIRNARRDGNEQVKKQKADGDIPEDVMKKLEKKIQELTDTYCKSADNLTEEKEKEILTL
ncbi:MAG: Ribosome-recycling factor [Chlamydiales bacterium]|nr:Ribosome-recycling factor [Chlamydiales bacterium]